jgi:hypothetical protein
MIQHFGLLIAAVVGGLLRFAMKTVLLILTFLTIRLPAAFGQPIAAGRAPNVDAYVGYAYVNENASANRASLNGVDSGITDAFPHFGLQGDIGYVRTNNINGSTHQADLLTFMAGPVFTRVERNTVHFMFVPL